MSNSFYPYDKDKNNGNVLLYKKEKDKHISYFDNIPERYKRREYIIDKLHSKKQNVDLD